ncbi:CoA-binding protein [Pararhodobacter marinus]|uniref:CoA-binding protein n=1 Tax=Pararhodobacter marinus TaxID=2184063 RepID=A0A2U2C641_9RHOB|nr:CoA-binding protein [Pararhodobacter marinus]PWE27350.1 CoA-binding protein [Pararhodobacter marinus]
MTEALPDAPDDATLRKILKSVKTVAVVGVSSNEIRPSYYVARYLKLKGMRVIPVNPGLEGQSLFGETVVADVTDAPAETDMVDIFRRSEHVAPIVRAALDALPNLRVVWLQIGVVSDEARAMCAERGVTFIQNRCPKIEYQRLFGELRMGGFNTGVISSKL